MNLISNVKNRISHVIILTSYTLSLTFNVYIINSCIHFFSSIHLQELKESFNYGLFCPPSNGKAGKFLDEERRLGDYPFNGPVGYLEVSAFLLL